MSFLFIDGSSSVDPQIEEQWQPFCEYEWDLDTHEFVIRDGQIRILEGIPALKIWIYKTLLTQRGRYRAYTWDYGNDLDTLIGISMVGEVVTSEAKRITEEAIYVNKHILNLRNFTAWLDDNTLHIEFIAVTDSGEVEVKSNV